MLVNLVDGCVQAKNVAPGSAMWTLDGDRTVRTTVVDVTAVKARTAVDVVTDHMTFTVSPDLLLATPDGWAQAADAAGKTVAWTYAKKLCRERLAIWPGYEFGYFVGATCADGTVGKNYVSLVVNEEHFAARYAKALTACMGLPARLEAVSRPSGYLKRDLAGFRVRVVSSYLADALRHYVGGDAHHMRQRFPRVVLRDLETFEGFLDGYIEGDGCNLKHGQGRMIVSANVPFLVELAQVIGARFTPSKRGGASQLYVSNRWVDRGTFAPEHHPLDPPESSWINVHEVRPRP
ncbi:hypothetical protein, partial [Streptomyces sp. WAC08241]|uniref:hypothetical protein n=1 Tax=Streptomyces sp. WAC08241 TaxID=2487421 RepID=UPI000F79ABA2